MSSIPHTVNVAVRHARLNWYAGCWQARVFVISTVALTFALLVALWAIHARVVSSHVLDARVASLRQMLATAEARRIEQTPPDFAASLPPAPEAAEVMRTLQLASAKERAVVTSLQADKHDATPTSLGHLDLVVSIKAPYPTIVMMFREVLDRYPGATIRQFSIHGPTIAQTAGTGSPSVSTDGNGPGGDSEARVTLVFWDRPAMVH
jgi:hypothetical protein